VPFCAASLGCRIENGVATLAPGVLTLPLTYAQARGRVKVEMDVWSPFDEAGEMYLGLGQAPSGAPSATNGGGARFAVQGSGGRCVPRVGGGGGNTFAARFNAGAWNRVAFLADVPRRAYQLVVNGVARGGAYSVHQPNSVAAPHTAVHLTAAGGVYRVRDVRVSTEF
jgi:hypothetical protein